MTNYWQDRFLSHVRIDLVNYYNRQLKNIVRTFHAQIVRNNENIQPQPQN